MITLDLNDFHRPPHSHRDLYERDGRQFNMINAFKEDLLPVCCTMLNVVFFFAVVGSARVESERYDYELVPNVLNVSL